jgi:hypothetical protein
MRFEVEYADQRRHYVIARQLEAGTFEWPPKTTLGGRQILAVTMPRALDVEGRPRTDLWAFELEGGCPERGTIVTLVPNS